MQSTRLPQISNSSLVGSTKNFIANTYKYFKIKSVEVLSGKHSN